MPLDFDPISDALATGTNLEKSSASFVINDGPPVNVLAPGVLRLNPRHPANAPAPAAAAASLAAPASSSSSSAGTVVALGAAGGLAYWISTGGSLASLVGAAKRLLR